VTKISTVEKFARICSFSHGPSSQSCDVVCRTQKRTFEHASPNRAAEFFRRFLESFFVISIGLSGESRLIGFARNGKGLAVNLDNHGAKAFQFSSGHYQRLFRFPDLSLIFIEPIDAWYTNS
jgi:hypothetical protein